MTFWGSEKTVKPRKSDHSVVTKVPLYLQLIQMHTDSYLLWSS